MSAQYLPPVVEHIGQSLSSKVMKFGGQLVRTGHTVEIENDTISYVG